MKKILSAVCAAALVLTAGSAFAAPKMQILGSLGVGYYSNSDVDKDFDDLESALETLGYKSYTRDNLSVGAGINAEFRYFFNDSLGAGLSLGYYSVYSGSIKADSYDGVHTYFYSYDFDLAAVPVMANLYYRVNNGENFLLLGAGLGIVHGSASYKEKSDQFGYTELDLTQNVFGCQAMVEYDWVWNSGFTLFAGLKGRYAKFDKMEDGIYFIEFKPQFTGAEIYIGAGASID